ncbi:MAG: hypothetical protein IT529_08830 [Burkholderiales bacterium]|nr:hypothetical protein [Burkholderiales bacterium]
MKEESGNEGRHFTTRRGFITAAGFGVVSLYGLWAAYGAAPLGLHAPEKGHDEHGAAAEPAGHGEHGAAAGPSPAEFRRLAERFAETHKLPDGSVQPRPVAAADPHAGHGAAEHAAAAPAAVEPIDVYLMAYQWGFTPAILRLARDTQYRFRMMAVDVTHGLALRVGPASRITRLRSGALVEQALTFLRPGEYLVYCTSYCGLLHDRMRATIVVS